MTVTKVCVQSAPCFLDNCASQCGIPNTLLWMSHHNHGMNIDATRLIIKDMCHLLQLSPEIDYIGDFGSYRRLCILET